MDVKKIIEEYEILENEGVLARVQAKREKAKQDAENAEKESYSNYVNSVIADAKQKDYLNSVFKKYQFKVMDEVIIDDDADATLNIVVPSLNNEAGMDIFINVDKKGISFTLCPYDFKNLDMEVPFGDNEEFVKQIFNTTSEEWYQLGDYDKIIKKVAEYGGQQVADYASEVLEKYIEENYDNIMKVIGA